MPTMSVEQGTCEIYPSKQLQFCMRIKVLVVPLTPDEEFNWKGAGETLRDVDITCSERGLNRLLGKIDDGTKPPPKRKTAADAK